MRNEFYPWALLHLSFHCRNTAQKDEGELIFPNLQVHCRVSQGEVWMAGLLAGHCFYNNNFNLEGSRRQLNSLRRGVAHPNLLLLPFADLS